jgi:hypothetical protein
MSVENWQECEDARDWPRAVTWQDHHARNGPFTVSVDGDHNGDLHFQLGYGYCVMHGYEIENDMNWVEKFPLADLVRLRDLLTATIDRYREPEPTVVDV